MRVEVESKQKRAKLPGEVEELALRVETIRKQVSAIDQVIAIHDPAPSQKQAFSIIFPAAGQLVAADPC